MEGNKQCLNRELIKKLVYRDENWKLYEKTIIAYIHYNKELLKFENK